MFFPWWKIVFIFSFVDLSSIFSEKAHTQCYETQILAIDIRVLLSQELSRYIDNSNDTCWSMKADEWSEWSESGLRVVEVLVVRQ